MLNSHYTRHWLQQITWRIEPEHRIAVMCEHCETFIARLWQPLPTFVRKGLCNGKDWNPITLLGSRKPTSDSNKFKLRPFYSLFLKVDEEGAEDAAATVAQFCTKCAVIRLPPPPPLIPFVVDHPFFFCILSPQPESSLRLPMFTGHCLLPVAKNR